MARRAPTRDRDYKNSNSERKAELSIRNCILTHPSMLPMSEDRHADYGVAF